MAPDPDPSARVYVDLTPRPCPRCQEPGAPAEFPGHLAWLGAQGARCLRCPRGHVFADLSEWCPAPDPSPEPVGAATLFTRFLTRYVRHMDGCPQRRSREGECLCGLDTDARALYTAIRALPAVEVPSAPVSAPRPEMPR